MELDILMGELKALFIDIDRHADSPTITIADARQYCDRSWVIIQKSVPHLHEKRFAYIAGAAAEKCCRYASLLEDWDRTARAGLILLSVAQIYQLEHGLPNKPYSVEISRSLRLQIDDIAYSFHRAGLPLAISQAVEAAFGSNFRIHQTARLFCNPEQTELDAFLIAEVFGHMQEGFGPSDCSSYENRENTGTARWHDICRTITAALETDDIVRRWGLAQGALAETPLLAATAGIPVVFLIAGRSGGAAIKFHGGADWAKEPVGIDLPDLTTSFVSQTCASLEASSTSISVGTVFESLIETMLIPLRKQFKSLEQCIIVPVGECLRLPIGATLAVAGGAASASTIAPSPGMCLIPALTDPAPHTSVSVIADPSKGKNHLPWVAKEARAVASLWGKEPDLLVKTPRFQRPSAPTTVRVLRRLPARRAADRGLLSDTAASGLVHLACHGWIDHHEGGEPYLLIGAAVPLSAFDATHIRLGSTYILSACYAGGSAQDNPIECVGFPSMLLSSGARQVVASLYPVPDSIETVEFMKNIHRRLRDGKPAHNALREAMEWAQEISLSPAVWSGFQCFGTP